MAKSRDSYIITGNSLDEIKRNMQFLLQRMADRMDKIEGIRGTSSIESDLDMNFNRVTEIGEGANETDSARVGDLLVQPPTFTGLTVAGDTTFRGDVRVYDASGNLIHSLE